MTLKKIYNWLRKRGTRSVRLSCALTALRVRMQCLPENKWNMTDAEDREYRRLYDATLRDYERLKNLGKRWGYRLP